MYCGNCGAKLPEGVSFCTKCGEKIFSAPTATSGATPQTENTQAKNYKAIGMGAVAVVLVLVIILASALFGKSGYEKTIDNLFDAVHEGNTEEILELFPEPLMNQMTALLGSDYTAFYEELDEGLSEFTEIYGEDWDISYEIIGVEDVVLDEQNWNEMTSVYVFMGIEVEEAKTVEVEAAITTENEEEVATLEIPLIKIDGDWYLDIVEMGSFF